MRLLLIEVPFEKPWEFRLEKAGSIGHGLAEGFRQQFFKRHRHPGQRTCKVSSNCNGSGHFSMTLA